MQIIKKTLNLLIVLTILSSMTVILIPAASALASNFVVNSTGDSSDANAGDNICETATTGECTLRAAIEEANANANPSDVDTITFAILGSGQQTINVTGEYDQIVEPVFIDGSTQGVVDCDTHTLLINLNGQGTGRGIKFGSSADGSSVNAMSIQNFAGGIDSDGAGIEATCNVTSNNLDAGFIFSSADGSLFDNNLAEDNNMGIQISDSNDIEISNNILSNNNQRGVQTDNTPDVFIHDNVADANGDSGIRTEDAPGAIVQNNITTNSGSNGILLEGDSSDILIEDNVSGFNTATGLNVTDGAGVIVRHNFIGVDNDGLTPMPNGQAGVVISAGTSTVSGIVVGGTDVSDRNIIANSGRGDLVFVAAGGVLTGNRVSGNYLGVNINGDVDTNFTNVGYGLVFLGDVHDNIAGGTTPAEANIIGGNDAGIGVMSLGPFVPHNNSIVGNSIYANHDGVVGTPGIDLAEDTDFDFQFDTGVGVTQNDAGDSDAGPNDYLNFPIVTGITTDQDNVSIKYTLDAPVPSGTVSGYRVEFYANVSANPSGHGDGQIYLGFENISGPVTDHIFDISNTGLPAGTYSFALTATAIDSASTFGFGNTSEFSAVEVAGISITNSGGVTTTTTTTPSSSTQNSVGGSGNSKSASGSLASTGSTQTSTQVQWALLFLALGVSSVLSSSRKLRRSLS